MATGVLATTGNKGQKNLTFLWQSCRRCGESRRRCQRRSTMRGNETRVGGVKLLSAPKENHRWGPSSKPLGLGACGDDLGASSIWGALVGGLMDVVFFGLTPKICLGTAFRVLAGDAEMTTNTRQRPHIYCSLSVNLRPMLAKIVIIIASRSMRLVRDESSLTSHKISCLRYGYWGGPVIDVRSSVMGCSCK